MAKKFTNLPKQLMSKKILKLFLDEFSFYGNISFYILLAILARFLGNRLLFQRMMYAFLISFIVVIAIKGVHYKDRPQKEEFTIFMERVIASSFPSTHSMTATGVTIFYGLAYPYPWLFAVMVVLSILVYIQRYISKKHFLIDIIGGIFIAVVEAIFVIKVL